MQTILLAYVFCQINAGNQTFLFSLEIIKNKL